ncbi:hypothetical protein Tco_0250073, partial [Tanacetum coccineum]
SAASVTDGPTDPFTPVFQPVHTVAPSLPPGHSLGSSEHSTRYPSPFDLANSMSLYSEIEDIHHHPDSGIFSSSSYDDDFGGTVTNLAPSIVVDSVPTKRVNTIHLFRQELCKRRCNSLLIRKYDSLSLYQMGKLLLGQMDSEEQKRCQ